MPVQDGSLEEAAFIAGRRLGIRAMVVVVAATAWFAVPLMGLGYAVLLQLLGDAACSLDPGGSNYGELEHPAKLAGITQRPRQIERFKYLHDLLARQHPPRRTPDRQRTSTRAELMATNGQNRWPPAGTYMAATGHDLMATDSRAASIGCTT